MTIHNLEALGTTTLRRDALAIAEAGYDAVNVRDAVLKKVRVQGDVLQTPETTISIANRRIFFVGVGKCAVAAAEIFEQLLGDRLTAGIALDVRHAEHQIKKIAVFAGTHPRPSDPNVQASKLIFDLLSGCSQDDLVITLISGGGSTLLCFPHGEMTCLDEGVLFDALTHAGASIHELNTVRKHISKVRGGGLAVAAYPAQVCSFIISDVPGNRIESIASGPTVLDSSTIEDARAILEKYGLQLPPGGLFETKKNAIYFERVTNLLLLTNLDALHAMKAKAESLGYKSRIENDAFEGEAKEMSKAVLESLRNEKPKAAVLWGGECTVTLASNSGKGGRNQELALAALADIKEGELILPFASDGRDATEYAGGIADMETLGHAQAKNLQISDFLAKHASFDFFTTTNDMIETGPLESNVSDLIIALKA